MPVQKRMLKSWFNKICWDLRSVTWRVVRNFMKEQAGETAIVDAFKAYHAAVLDGSFPAKEHTFQIEL